MRYPLLGDRLVPYVLAGGGVAITELNDRRPAARGLEIDAGQTAPAGLLGGVEAFVTSNVSFHVEAKHIRVFDQSFVVGPRAVDADIGALAFTAGVRVNLLEF